MRRGVFALVCLSGIVLAGCGGADAPASRVVATPPADRAAKVTVAVFQFQPSPLVITVGTTVTWTNRDDIAHTATAGTPEGRTGRFDLALAGKDTTVAFTFTEAGSYPYFCARHESMRGEVRVT